jgi:hypothetical protein
MIKPGRYNCMDVRRCEDCKWCVIKQENTVGDYLGHGICAIDSKKVYYCSHIKYTPVSSSIVETKCSDARAALAFNACGPDGTLFRELTDGV